MSVAGSDRAIDASELQQCITRSRFVAQEFSLETCRLLITMLDADGNGTMGFAEFQQMWEALSQWRACFKTFDLDDSGAIDYTEAERALTNFGFRLSPAVMTIIMRRYSKPGPSEIGLDDFVSMTVRLRYLSAEFTKRDPRREGVAVWNYDDFLATVLRV